MEKAVAHRKIELQSHEDFTYLLANVRRAAQQRLDEAFPPVDADDSEDDLRSHIERLVQEYINKTFTLAAPNLSINGLPFDPQPYLSDTPSTAAAVPTETYEPFDERKHQRVLDLAREEEDLLAEIAALKHKVPLHVTSSVAEHFRAGLEADERALKLHSDALVKNSVEQARRELQAAEALVKGLERQEDVEKKYHEVLEALGRLARDMPSTVAKMERARVAGEYVVTQGQ
ncbi:hypothetical protein TD95_000528 [Thielaviopsis punctulata]|uniref:Kinetochore protein mis14 n=1 Tax=Thielaviopsis punctulata TaxID=72032 RepID=A0A0F4Z9M4_9PEZI|nr:hypothetical protein TD95_000528 [Thielaviopsis punctulata]